MIWIFDLFSPKKRDEFCILYPILIVETPYCWQRVFGVSWLLFDRADFFLYKQQIEGNYDGTI